MEVTEKQAKKDAAICAFSDLTVCRRRSVNGALRRSKIKNGSYT
jgi:hypothetical protein